MVDWISNAGSGAGGTIIGAALAFFGFKDKLKSIDKDIADVEENVTTLKENVVYKDTCDANVRAITEQLKQHIDLMKETREDFKEVLKKL